MAPADVAAGQGDASSADACSATLSTRKPCTGLILARPAIACVHIPDQPYTGYLDGVL